MSLAPSKGEQAALYIEIFTYSAGGLVLLLLGIVLNWRIAKNVGEAVSKLVPSQFGSLELRQTAIKWLANWQNEYRRVRRLMTFLVAGAFFISAFAASCILAIAGTVQRADGVDSQWQRWAGYTLAMTFTTAAMTQYYALETTAALLMGLFPAAAGMGMGVYISLTAKGVSGGVAKVVNFSIWGPVLLLGLIPIFYAYTTYNLLKRWWRGLPIAVHVLFAMGVWIVLWAGPEVSSNNTKFARVTAAWAYYVIVLIWYLVLLFFFYFWDMGPPKRRTSATDAIITQPGETSKTGKMSGRTGQQRGGSAGPRKVVNFDQRSPNYSLPKSKPGAMVPESSRRKARVRKPPHVVINLRS